MQLFFNSNCRCTTELPTPDIVSTLFLDEGEELFLSGCDLLQYYNSLRARSDLVLLIRFLHEANFLRVSQDYRYVTPFLN